MVGEGDPIRRRDDPPPSLATWTVGLEHHLGTRFEQQFLSPLWGKCKVCIQDHIGTPDTAALGQGVMPEVTI